MSRNFNATLLLTEPWPLDIDAVADAVRRRFPKIGAVEAVEGQGVRGESGVLTVDSGNVVLKTVPAPFARKQLSPSLKTLKTWDPEPVIRDHQAHLTISCGGAALSGVDGAKAYAATCHFVAAAAATVAPASAVFWREGWTLTETDPFVRSTGMMLQGRMPMGAWISFASIVPRDASPDNVAGMVTYGLKPFIGRELELAPRDGDARAAYRILSNVVRSILNRGFELHDGQKIVDEANDVTMAVSARTYWLRRDLSAFVLITEDSVLDRQTLRPREVATA